jgi:hypothetical protein
MKVSAALSDCVNVLTMSEVLESVAYRSLASVPLRSRLKSRPAGRAVPLMAVLHHRMPSALVTLKDDSHGRTTELPTGTTRPRAVRIALVARKDPVTRQRLARRIAALGRSARCDVQLARTNQANSRTSRDPPWRRFWRQRLQQRKAYPPSHAARAPSRSVVTAARHSRRTPLGWRA